jgi:hypothetical protein
MITKIDELIRANMVPITQHPIRECNAIMFQKGASGVPTPTMIGVWLVPTDSPDNTPTDSGVWYSPWSNDTLDDVDFTHYTIIREY